MATQLKPPPEALFPEARARQRRRRLRWVSAIVLVGGLCVAVGWLLSGPASTASSSHSARSLTSRVTLPRAAAFFSLADVAGRLIVSGGPRGSLFPSGSIASLSHGRVVGTCDAATVDPVTLRLGPVTHANCGDPALYGERVLAVSSLVRRVSSGGFTDSETIRIARADPAARDGYTLGPILMTYLRCSDCGAEWIDGDGALWIYAAVTGRPGAPAELVRVSGTTGRVVQHWAMPAVIRALLAVDADGLWIAPSNETGTPASHLTAAQSLRYESVYLVSPGARAPRRVFTVGPGGAAWLVAAGHTAWVADESGWRGFRLSGPSATPTSLGRYPARAQQSAEYGAGAPSFAADAALGIAYVVNGDGTQRVVDLAPNTAARLHITTVAAPSGLTIDGSSPPAVARGRSLYFLDPPMLSYPAGDGPPRVRGSATLYRVTAR